ncbi:MAG: hypothetical protein MJ204_07145 [Bacteroidales bacterium]|nr:hypothetical protein [Bacteroidales bacterium]
MKLGIESYCRITNEKVIVNDKTIAITREQSWLTDIYHSAKISYPKFFKMDNLAKSGFLGSELALQPLEFNKNTIKEDIAVVCCNRSSSLDDDTSYQKTIQNNDDYYPSPAVFVYTLANIVTGEISIRNKTMGESAFYVMEQFNPQKFCSFAESAFLDSNIQACICGWVEYYNENCDVLFTYITRNSKNNKELNIDTIHTLYNL